MDPWLEAFARALLQRGADTAHDLKTPLNVAVLNLELLRMRLANLPGFDADEKAAEHARSIESELRRMARIVDAYFLLASPPPDEGEPAVIDLSPLLHEAATAAGFSFSPNTAAAPVRAHRSRMREMLGLFFEGVGRLLQAGGREITTERSGTELEIAVRGTPADAGFEATRIFKFYYTDPQGNPELSPAAARLIAETYGGRLEAVRERDKVTFRLLLPLVTR